MASLSDWKAIPTEYDPLKAGSIDGTDTEPHDNGVLRAMQARYYPNPRVVGDPRKTLFVARLNPKTTEETIHKMFSNYGNIVRCRLIRDIVTGFSKCYAFVEFEDDRSIVKAHRDAYKMELEGSEVFVDYECERALPGWIPRRLGGGFGGKKESGQLRFGGRFRPFRRPILIDGKQADMPLCGRERMANMSGSQHHASRKNYQTRNYSSFNNSYSKNWRQDSRFSNTKQDRDRPRNFFDERSRDSQRRSSKRNYRDEYE